MESVAFLAALLAVAAWPALIWLRAAYRQANDRCARCGVALHPVDMPGVTVSDWHGGTTWRMCHPCARRTRWGWLYLLAGTLLLAAVAIAAAKFGWLPVG